MMRSEGTSPPASLIIVVNRSMVQPISRTTAGLIMQGHHVTQGSRMPPSNVQPLPSRSRPAEPPSRLKVNHGPLSEVKTTKVFFASFSRSSVSRT